MNQLAHTFLQRINISDKFECFICINHFQYYLFSEDSIMEKFRKVLLICIVASLCLAMVAIAQDAPAPGGGAGMGGMGAAPGGAAPGTAVGRGIMMRGRGGGAFPESIVKDVIPFIEKSYRTLTGQANRAIAGLSMGGMHTSSITLAHPETFSYYGLMSGGTYNLKQLAAHKAKLKLVFMSCGSRENPDGVKNAADALTKAGFNAVSNVSEDSVHEWLTWRRSLIQLTPFLFKD